MAGFTAPQIKPGSPWREYSLLEPAIHPLTLEGNLSHTGWLLSSFHPHGWSDIVFRILVWAFRKRYNGNIFRFLIFFWNCLGENFSSWSVSGWVLLVFKVKWRKLENWKYLNSYFNNRPSDFWSLLFLTWISLTHCWMVAISNATVDLFP